MEHTTDMEEGITKERKLLTMKQIKLLTIKFDNEISSFEVPYFRGAVNAALEEHHSILFHNHTEDGLRYSYPLIQYKRLNKKAAIVCLEEGTEAIGEFFSTEQLALPLGNKTIDFVIEDVAAEDIPLEITNNTYKYKIRNWLPFNARNYKQYQEMEGILEKASFMERMLVGNILSFLKGIGEHVEERIVCSITDIGSNKPVYYKGIRLMSFDIAFNSNITLPSFIGIGKGVSVGYGTLFQKEK